jgi:heme exporter protein D
MSHFAFVTIAYAVTAVVILAMIAWVLLDQRARKQEIADLEARGIRRRSAAGIAGNATHDG